MGYFLMETYLHGGHQAGVLLLVVPDNALMHSIPCGTYPAVGTSQTMAPLPHCTLEDQYKVEVHVCGGQKHAVCGHSLAHP